MKRLALFLVLSFLFGLAATGPIADRNHREFVTPDQVKQFPASRSNPLFLADDVDDLMAQHISELIERDQLAAAAKTRVDREYTMVVHGRLQQELPQIAREDFHRVLFRNFRQLAAQFPLEARDQQSTECVPHAAPQKLGVRMIGWNQQRICLRGHRLQERLPEVRERPVRARSCVRPFPDKGCGRAGLRNGCRRQQPQGVEAASAIWRGWCFECSCRGEP